MASDDLDEIALHVRRLPAFVRIRKDDELARAVEASRASPARLRGRDFSFDLSQGIDEIDFEPPILDEALDEVVRSRERQNHGK